MSNKSFKTVVREAMFNSLVKSVEAIKSNNVDNGVVRDCKALHANTTFEDLPNYTKTALNQAVDNFLTKLIAEGYTITAKD